MTVWRGVRHGALHVLAGYSKNAQSRPRSTWAISGLWLPWATLRGEISPLPGQRAGLFLLVVKAVNPPSSVFLCYNAIRCMFEHRGAWRAWVNWQTWSSGYCWLWVMQPLSLTQESCVFRQHVWNSSQKRTLQWEAGWTLRLCRLWAMCVFVYVYDSVCIISHTHTHTWISHICFFVWRGKSCNTALVVYTLGPFKFSASSFSQLDIENTIGRWPTDLLYVESNGTTNVLRTICTILYSLYKI